MDSKPAGERFRLYSPAQLEAVLEGMARQAAAMFDPRQEVLLVGILRRGEPLAQRLQDILAERHGLPRWPLHPLRLKRYADDLSLLHAQTALTENPELVARDLSHCSLLVVDDVLYEGHSLLRACAWLAQQGGAMVVPVAFLGPAGCRRGALGGAGRPLLESPAGARRYHRPAPAGGAHRHHRVQRAALRGGILHRTPAQGTELKQNHSPPHQIRPSATGNPAPQAYNAPLRRRASARRSRALRRRRKLP